MVVNETDCTLLQTDVVAVAVVPPATAAAAADPDEGGVGGSSGPGLAVQVCSCRLLLHARPRKQGSALSCSLAAQAHSNDVNAHTTSVLVQADIPIEYMARLPGSRIGWPRLPPTN